MGILDRWTKKNEEAKLKDLDKKSSKPTKTTKTTAKTAAKPAVKPAAKKAKVEKPVAEVAPVAKKVVKPEAIAYKVLVRPLVTEKSAVMESQNKYSFIVTRNATKDQIKQAVVEAYGVRPIVVNTMNVEGKTVRFGRGYGRRSDYKKAVITLAAGQTIAIHEGV